MNQKDFSIRIEVEAMLETLGLEMSEKQVDDVVASIESYDTFLSIVSIFVANGIQEISERDGLPLNTDEIEKQIELNRMGINPDDL